MGCSGIWRVPSSNRVDARIVNNRDKQVIALEISFPWVSNRDHKTTDKTMKYAPRRWELKQGYPGYKRMIQGLGCHCTEASRQLS